MWNRFRSIARAPPVDASTMEIGGRVLSRAQRALRVATCGLALLAAACSHASKNAPAASAKSAASDPTTPATSAPRPDPAARATSDVNLASGIFDEVHEKYVPPPPRDPTVRAALQAKYSETTPTELRAVYDSLSEVLDAQRNKRFADKNLVLRDKDMRALENEVGWLAEKCAR
jgi:hypothetical protein